MKANNTPEVIESIELSKLHPFPDHPFAVRDDDTIQSLPCQNESTVSTLGRTSGIISLLIKFASPLSREKSHLKRQTRSVMTSPLGFSKANMLLWYVRTRTRPISITT